jgi:signal transduction histidine kinase
LTQGINFLLKAPTPFWLKFKGSIFLALFICASSVEGLAQENSFITNYPPIVYKASPAVYNIAIDHDGLIYFGTNKGITIFDGSRWETIPVSNYSEVRTLELGPDSLMYVGANGNFGYLKHDLVSGFQYISLSDSLTSNPTNYNDIWQIVFLNDKIYFQSYAGIFTWDNRYLKFDKIQEVFIFDLDGQLYASEYFSGTFGKYNQGKIEPIANFPNISYDLVFQIFDYDENHKLLSTSEAGLYLFNPVTQKTLPFETPLNKELAKYSFYDGLRLDQDHFAMGTFNGGIFFIKKSGEIINVFNKENGLFANHVYDMKLDKRNNLWLATSFGISKIKADSLGVKLPSSDASLEKPLFRNINFTTGNVSTSLYPNTQSGIISNMDFEYLEGNLELMLEPASLSFYFAHPGFKGDNIYYTTYLEGNDADWSEWRPEAFREYTNLDEGLYTFHVKAKNQNTGGISPEKTFAIRITAPWYQSAWLKIVIAIFIAFLIYIAVRLMIIRLKTQNTRLEKIVEERTLDLIQQQKQLSDTNKNLSATNKELDSFVYHTSHDLKAPLKSVLGLVKLAKMEDVKNQFTQYHDRIESSIHKLEEFISSIIQYSSNAKSSVKPERVDFVKLIEDAENELRNHENFQKICFEKNINVNGSFVSDSNRIQIIVNNLISNAVKYCDLSKTNQIIKININQSESKIKIVIEDNGLGINKDYQEKVFSMFYRASEKSYGSGLGLYIVKETVKRLGGSIEIESSEGEYTRFIIKLPNQNAEVPT